MGVLGRKCTVFWYPVLGVMWFFKRIANAGVTGCEDTIAFAFHTWRIEFEIHEFVHIA